MHNKYLARRRARGQRVVVLKVLNGVAYVVVVVAVVVVVWCRSLVAGSWEYIMMFAHLRAGPLLLRSKASRGRDLLGELDHTWELGIAMLSMFPPGTQQWNLRKQKKKTFWAQPSGDTTESIEIKKKKGV